jgi:hypothetical protein
VLYEVEQNGKQNKTKQNKTKQTTSQTSKTTTNINKTHDQEDDYETAKEVGRSEIKLTIWWVD